MVRMELLDAEWERLVDLGENHTIELWDRLRSCVYHGRTNQVGFRGWLVWKADRMSLISRRVVGQPFQFLQFDGLTAFFIKYTVDHAIRQRFKHQKAF